MNRPDATIRLLYQVLLSIAFLYIMTSFFKNIARQFSSTSAVGIVPSATAGESTQVAIFANGCFWVRALVGSQD